MSTPQTVKSADRVLTIFELLGQWRDGLTLTELSEHLGIPKSSLSQLLKNLVQRDWLAYSTATKAYTLGEAFRRHARLETQRVNIGAIAGPALQEITDRFGESAAFGVIKGHRLEIVAAATGTQRLTSLIRVGDRTPLHVSAGGRAVLAFASANIVDDYLSVLHLHESEAHEPAVTPEQLRRVLAVIRAQGVAFAHDEPVQGLTEVARPVLAASGSLLGGVITAVPTSRYTDSIGLQLSDALARVAKEISGQIG